MPDDDFWLPVGAAAGLWAAPAAGPTYLEVARAATSPDAPLPDDGPPDEGGLLWAPGALAGVLSHHTSPLDTPQDPLVALVRTIGQVRAGAVDRSSLVEAYEGLRSLTMVTRRDIALATQAEDAPDSTDAARAYTEAAATLAAWLVCRGTHRGPVKAGLAIASMITWPPLAERAAVLGRLNELSHEASVVLLHQAEPDERGLLALAQWHTGWGRVHAVEALCRLTSRSPDVDDWLVSTGWSNTVSDGYTAPVVAGTVDVASRVVLIGPDGLPDEERLAATRRLLRALLDEHSPGAHLADIPGAVGIIDQWFLGISMLPASGLRIEDLELAEEILGALEDDVADIIEEFGAPQAARIASRCRTLLLQEASRDAVLGALQDVAGPFVVGASRLAPRHGIDPVPALRDRVRHAPDDTAAWFALTNHPRRGDDLELVDFALGLLGPDYTSQTATFPVGPGRRVHMALQFLWQGPGRDPWVGLRIVEALLRSPATDARERGAAWLDRLPAEVLATKVDVLARIAREEVEPATRAVLVDVLATLPGEGEPADPVRSADVLCWAGPRMGFTSLAARSGVLTLAQDRLTFTADDARHSRDLPLAQVTRWRAGARGNLVVSYRAEGGRDRSLTFGLHTGMPDVDGWVSALALAHGGGV
ncbi:hypothetical protein [Oryzobacter telluris]|uniref:hypothetical protein n=1 Tax=Oryzobacter telluris TaxID=3149179 RepID=UPI00370DD03F